MDFQDRLVASVLFVGHVTEVALQVLGCVLVWRQDGDTDVWAGGLFGLTLTTMVLLNFASTVWVQKRLDFAGRSCGQLVCYGLHVAQLGLVWRFLKLNLVRDRADVREYCMLRFAQVHVQTLPYATLFLCFFYNQQCLGVMSIAMASILLVSCVSTTVAIMALSYKSKNSTDIEECDNQKKNSRGTKVVVTVVLLWLQKVLLLWSRMLAIGLFLSAFHLWTLSLVGIHWIVCVVWVGLKDNIAGDQYNDFTDALKWCLYAYIFIYDLYPREDKLGMPQINISKKNVGVFYFFVTVENLLMLLLWYTHLEESAAVDTALLASSLSMFAVGIVFSFLINWSVLPSSASESDVNGEKKTAVDDHEEVPQHNNNVVVVKPSDAGSIRSNAYSPDPLTALHQSAPSLDNGSSNSRNTNTLELSLADQTEVHIQEFPPAAPLRAPIKPSKCNSKCTSKTVGSFTASVSTLSGRLADRRKLKKQLSFLTSMDSASRRFSRCCGDEQCDCKIFDCDKGKIYRASRVDGAYTACLTHLNNSLYNSRRFRILCANCLQSHDPLLTSCAKCHSVEHLGELDKAPAYIIQWDSAHSELSMTTDYPSDSNSVCSNKSTSSCSEWSVNTTATYTTWPPTNKLPQMSKLLETQFSGHEYVEAWLRFNSPKKRRDGQVIRSKQRRRKSKRRRGEGSSRRTKHSSLQRTGKKKHRTLPIRRKTNMDEGSEPNNTSAQVIPVADLTIDPLSVRAITPMVPSVPLVLPSSPKPPLPPRFNIPSPPPPHLPPHRLSVRAVYIPDHILTPQDGGYLQSETETIV